MFFKSSLWGQSSHGPNEILSRQVLSPFCCVLLVILVLPHLTAYLVLYRHARLDSVTIPEYFAPPRVFCAGLCEERDAVEISSRVRQL